jgi:hypothetical protein
MDTIYHTALGASIAAAASQPPEIIVASGVAGALADVVGFAEKVYKDDWHTWKWYNFAHGLTFAMFFSTICIIASYVWGNSDVGLIFLVAHTLHVAPDALCHEPPSRWWVKGEGLIMFEIIPWVALILGWVVVLVVR